MNAGGDDDDEVFREAMRDVVPLPRRQRRVREDRPKRAPGERPQSARITVEDDGERVSGRATGVSRRQLRELRSGTIPADEVLDLHGMRADDARRAVRARIAEAHAAGLRCVRVVHGRGLHSGERAPVLRTTVIEALTSGDTSQLVRAFCTAARRDGGPGAINVWLVRADGQRAS